MVAAAETRRGAAVGDSVAVGGVCLTVVEAGTGRLAFDAVPETLAGRRSGGSQPGDAVNLEPALRVGEPLGGHVVQGHVDGVGRVRSVEPEGEAAASGSTRAESVLRYCVEKGSIAVDGMSLTVAALDDDGFAVALIPHTLAETTLGALEPGDEVNLEVDVLAKYVERLLAATMAVSAAVTPFATVEEAIEDIRQGKMVVVVDDADRENEGDLDDRRAVRDAGGDQLHGEAGPRPDLPLPHRRALRRARAAEDDRAQRDAVRHRVHRLDRGARGHLDRHLRARPRAHDPGRDRPASKPQDIVQPGHVFPLRAREGGVLERAGQTEAAVDLARLAGLIPAGVICEIMKDDGTMARVPDLVEFCEQHGLRIVTVADLIEYRRRHEKLVEREVTVRLPTAYGEFTAIAFRETLTGKQHVALVKGDVGDDVLVRVHSECLTGDVFHSLRCDCGEQLDAALRLIAAEGRGVLLYMAQEGRGIGLLNKLKAYELQEEGLDTVDANLALGFAADEREWGIGNQILAELGLTTIRLLTNNPKKVSGLEAFGLKVTQQVPIEMPPNDENRRYLAAKRDKLGHRLHHQGLKFESEGE